jgi:hypothetical protein
VTVTVTGTDDASGIIAGGVTFVGCRNGVELYWGWNEINPSTGFNGGLVAGTRRDGTFEGVLTIPAFIESCTATVWSISLCDAVNHCVTFRDFDTPTSISIINTG